MGFDGEKEDPELKEREKKAQAKIDEIKQEARERVEAINALYAENVTRVATLLGEPDEQVVEDTINYACLLASDTPMHMVQTVGIFMQRYSEIKDTSRLGKKPSEV